MNWFFGVVFKLTAIVFIIGLGKLIYTSIAFIYNAISPTLLTVFLLLMCLVVLVVAIFFLFGVWNYLRDNYLIRLE